MTQKLKKEKNMFVWKPVTIVKLNLCLNLRMLFFFLKHLSKFSIMLVLTAYIILLLSKCVLGFMHKNTQSQLFHDLMSLFLFNNVKRSHTIFGLNKQLFLHKQLEGDSL